MGHYFHALLVVPGRIVLEKGRPRLDVGSEKPLRAEWRSRPLRALASRPEFVGPDLFFSIWPRTKKGKLDPRRSIVVRLNKELPEGFSPGLHALGRLERVDREEGFFELAILPNPEGGLKDPFSLTIWAGLELLENLPPPGSGIRIEGELRPKSLRLVATGVEEVPLPSTGGRED